VGWRNFFSTVLERFLQPDNAQKTSRGHPDINSYVQNLLVFIFQMDEQMNGQMDGEINPVWAG
jgi:hypothetical protein